MLKSLALILALAAPAYASAGTILVFGDSLSAGYGLAQNQGWTSLLAKRLREEGFDYQVANASLSGATTTRSIGEWGQVQAYLGHVFDGNAKRFDSYK